MTNTERINLIRLDSPGVIDLRSGLEEIQRMSIPGTQIIWSEEGWKRMTAAKADENWEGLKKGVLSNSEIINSTTNSSTEKFQDIFKGSKFSDVQFDNMNM